MADSEPKAAKGNRKTFVRTRVPVIERVSGWLIVSLIAGAGVAILVKGRHYDPDRFALRTEALASTIASVDGKSATVVDSDGRPVKTALAARKVETTQAPEAPVGYADYESETAPAPTTRKQEPLELRLDGIAPMQPTEFYVADNLFEKINGRAPAYLGFNFQQLRCRSFGVTGRDGSYVDVFEYLFDTPVNAFGMFALERDPAGKPVEFASDGYAGEMGFFFRQGPRYVQIIASDDEATTMARARAIAENRARSLPMDDTGLAARRRLPVAGLDPESITYIAENALGQSKLRDVFQAKYRFGGGKLNFFLMVATPADAEAAWTAYRDFASKVGKVTSLPDVQGARLFEAETFGTWNIIYLRNGEVGGVYEAGDSEKARGFLEQQLRGGAS